MMAKVKKAFKLKPSDNLLHDAAKRGDLPEVTRLVKEGSNVNAKDNNGRLPLYFAVKYGHLSVVEYLVNEAKVDINAKDTKGKISLYYAVKYDNLQVAKYLTDKFVVTNGYTPLHWAAKNGNLNIVKYLVEEKNIDVNIIDKEHNTPLHLAAESGNLNIITYLVGEKNADLNIKNKYGQTPIYLANKNNQSATVEYLQEGIVPVLEGINAIIGIGSGVMDILQKFGIIPDQESENFEKVFDALAKNYAAIEEVGNKVDRNFAVMKAVYEIARQTLDEIEETRYEMRVGFQRVLDSISELRVDDKISKVATFMSDFFTNEIDIINKLSRKDRLAKLKELSNVVTTAGGVLHDNLNDIIRQGLAIPNLEREGNSPENNARFAALHTLYYGTQVCVSVMFFVIEKYSLLAGDYYQTGEIEEYNEICMTLQTQFDAFKGILLKNDGIIYKVNDTLTTVQNLPLVKNEREDILELIPERIKSLVEVKDKLEQMKLPMIPTKPSKIMGVPDFSVSNITTAIGQWKDGTKVSYAVQYKNNNTYSQVSDWSYPVKINGKADPLLTIAVAGEEGRERLIFRRFDNGNAEMVGVMKEKDKIHFRDISRDIYDAAQSSDETRARADIKVFRKDGGDVNERFENGRKPIHAAVQSNNYNITLDLLSLNKTDINVKDANGYTPIYIAAEAGYADFVKSLIDLGADPNIKTNESNLTLTPLHIAAYKGFYPVVETLLLSNKTDINTKDMNDFTPLHSATFSNSVPTLGVLLNKNNIDVNAKSKEGLTPFHLAAVNKRHIDAARALLQSKRADVNANAKGNLTALHFAASIGNLDVAKVLIQHNETNVNAKSADNLTALHFSTSLKKDQISLELLNAQGIEVNTKGKGGITPLHFAAITEQKSVTLALLKKGALTEEKTNDGLTPLHSTVMYDKYEIIPILIDHGANIEAMTVNGSTPLHLSSFAGNENATSILLDKGANATVYDGSGQMPVHLTVLEDKKRTLKILVEHDANLVNIPNKYGECPIHLGAHYFDIVKYLVDEKDVDVNVKAKNDYTPVHYAAKYGQLDVIKYLIDKKSADFKLKGKDGKIPLHLGAEQGHLDIVKYFLDNKSVDVNTPVYDNQRKTSLHLASENGKLNIVEYLSNKKNVDIYVKDYNGNCPMHLAATKNKLDILKYFIEEKHAQIDTRAGFYNKHLLHLSAESGSLDIVTYLLTKTKSNVNVEDRDYNTPMHSATENDHIEIIEVLLDKGAAIDAKNRWKMSPMHFAAKKNYFGIIKYLVEKGADVNGRDSDGITPLHLAATGGYLDTVKYLVDEKHVDVKVKDNNGKTSLHFAAAGGHLDTVKYLADEKGVDVNMKDNKGVTSLHLASEGGYLDTVIYFIDKKSVDVNVKDNDGITPLYFAAENGKWDVATYLVSKNADVNISKKDGKTSLYFAAEKGNLDLVKLLVGKGADVNVKDDSGKTPLHLAVNIGKLDIVAFLVERGANIEAKDNSGWYGGTPLNYAASGGYIDIVKYLVAKAADVNAMDKSGITTLHCAVARGNLDIVKFLVENGARIDPKGLGTTPLFDAAKKCYLDIVKFLTEKGADVNTRDSSGYTPESFIVNQIIPRLLPNQQSCYLEMVKYLHSHRSAQFFRDKIQIEDDINVLDDGSRIPIQYSAVGKYLKSNDIHHTIGIDNFAGNLAASGASKTSSWINDFLGWIKDYAGRLFDVRYALPEISGRSFNPSSSAKSNQYTDKFNSEICISNNIGLGFFLLQSFLDKKYPLPQFCSISPEEVLAKTLNIVEEFEITLEETAKQYDISVEDFDFFKLYLRISSHIRNETFHQIPDTLYLVVKKGYSENDGFLNALKGNIEKMLDKKFIVNNEYQMQNRAPLFLFNNIANDKIRHYLNFEEVHKQLQ